jgi:hypothetical protein
MSLKAFHIVFIGASILLSLWVAGWQVMVFRSSHRPVDLLFAGLALVMGIALVFYGKYVMKKLKDISYL